jgi:hypothetical protein
MVREGEARALEVPVLRDVQVYCAGRRQVARNVRQRDAISCSDACDESTMGNQARPVKSVAADAARTDKARLDTRKTVR